ncbi:hypothetical protein ADUPG1_009975, partial [Aduncisulcus paluster]
AVFLDLSVLQILDLDPSTTSLDQEVEKIARTVADLPVAAWAGEHLTDSTDEVGLRLGTMGYPKEASQFYKSNALQLRFFRDSTVDDLPPASYRIGDPLSESLAPLSVQSMSLRMAVETCVHAANSILEDYDSDIVFPSSSSGTVSIPSTTATVSLTQELVTQGSWRLFVENFEPYVLPAVNSLREVIVDQIHHRWFFYFAMTIGTILVMLFLTFIVFVTMIVIPVAKTSESQKMYTKLFFSLKVQNVIDIIKGLSVDDDKTKEPSGLPSIDDGKDKRGDSEDEDADEEINEISESEKDDSGSEKGKTDEIRELIGESNQLGISSKNGAMSVPPIVPQYPLDDFPTAPMASTTLASLSGAKNKHKGAATIATDDSAFDDDMAHTSFKALLINKIFGDLLIVTLLILALFVVWLSAFIGTQSGLPRLEKARSLSHDLAIEAKKAHMYVQDLVLAEVGALSAAHASLKRTELVTTIKTVRENYMKLLGALIEGTDGTSVEGVAEDVGVTVRYPSTQTTLEVAACPRTISEACTAGTESTYLNELLVKYGHWIANIISAEEKSSGQLASNDDYINVNDTAYLDVVGGIDKIRMNLDTIEESTFGRANTVFYCMMGGFIILSGYMLIVGSQKQVKALDEERGMFLTVWMMVPQKDIPIQFPGGEELYVCLAYFHELQEYARKDEE